MKIVIPLSGEGSRFLKAGYGTIKPLIQVNDKPMIEWVMKLFPGETNVLFICRNEHLETTNLKEELNRICPTGKIVGIEGAKKGPVWAVSQAFDHLDEGEPTIINYCDFYMRWNYSDFKNFVLNQKCDGAIPCYKGFHPHLLHEKNYYASCRVDSENKLLEIKEKFSFTDNKMLSPQSAGTYYYKSGKIVKKYYEKMIAEDVSLNGEYYSSLVYNLMSADGLNSYVYDKIEHFCQWGTPEDLEEFLYWEKIFKGLKI